MKNLFQKFKNGLQDPPYNFIIQTAPFRQPHSDPRRWETVEKDFHWHIELMPRLTQVAGFEKGTGFYICSIPPESMAEYLRGVEAK
jgi:UDPglucose--hexose-1-phosphate uridylyltransferase